MTNYYGSRYSFYDKSTLAIETIIDDNELLPGNYAILTSSQLKKFQENASRIKSIKQLDYQQSFSLVLIKYEHVAERMGQVVFLSLDENREWQKKDLEMMQE